MPPHVRAEAPKPSLHLICDNESVSGVHSSGNLGKIAARQLWKALAGEGCAEQYGGQLDAVALEVIDGMLQVLHIGIGKLFVTAAVALSVWIDHRDIPNEGAPL